MIHMLQALALARMALGTTSPNPAVGALVVHDGQVVGSGYTQPPGSAHAEVVALRQAGESARGATMYVTLEPCCHHGRTPPCTDAIIAAGIAEVHVAVPDPNPLVAGQGIARLEAAGITVVRGEGEQEARRLNEAFFKWIITGRPFVAAKWAMTLDGKIATHPGASQWVTGPAARVRVHELRAAADAVLVGIGTVLADDPRLNVRLVPDFPPRRQPWRIIADTRCRLPVGAKVLSDGSADRTIVATSTLAPPERVEALRSTGCEIWTVPANAGRVDLQALLEMAAGRGIISIFAEAGGILTAGLIEQDLVDKVYVFVAPTILGGANAPTPVEGAGLPGMESAHRLEIVGIELVGDDALLTGYVREGTRNG